MKHRPKRIRRWSQDTSEGMAWCYTAACSCGAAFSERYGPHRAEEDLRAHLSEVAPPADERCRNPRSHRTKWWDACPVCADQLILPFEEFEETA